jgi:hypothetical protein
VDLGGVMTDPTGSALLGVPLQHGRLRVYDVDGVVQASIWRRGDGVQPGKLIGLTSGEVAELIAALRRALTVMPPLRSGR